jgi:hypothetical protein
MQKILIHRGLSSEDSDEDYLDGTMQEYLPGYTKFTSFFSNSPSDELLNTLIDFADKVTADYKVDTQTFRVQITYMDKEDKVVSLVSILKVPDEDKYCVEAILEEGDKVLFNSLFEDMKGFFGGHVNTTV